MLKKRSRLPREAFTTAFKKASRRKGLGFQVLYTPSPKFRASVVVSKKVEPTAVGRNRLRRMLYAWIRLFLDRSGIGSTMTGHYIVMVSKDIKLHTKTDVRTSLEGSFRAVLPPKT